METKFQTSFIPKASLTAPTQPRRRGAITFLMFFGMVVFFTSVALALGSYVWLKILTNQSKQLASDLAANEKAFEPNTIEEYVRLDSRIDNAKKLIDKHISLSSFLDLLGRETLKTISFADFKYLADPSGDISVEMAGRGASYNSVAFQAKEFGKIVPLKNPVFANLDLDPQGRVIFKLNMDLDPTLISFKDNLPKEADIVGGDDASQTTEGTNTESLPPADDGGAIDTSTNINSDPNL